MYHLLEVGKYSTLEQDSLAHKLCRCTVLLHHARECE
jgi:hypothetical protein